MVPRLARKALWLLIFLGTLTFVRRAQRNHFASLDGKSPGSFLGLFPHEEHGVTTLKDSVEEGNMQRVVAILQSNIKQWSFVESQLLEPNVNLGMPEIFIPLKHLTTTLEILANIFFVRNDLQEAKNCLERACPLMELLPASLLENAEQELLEEEGGQELAEFASFSPSHTHTHTHTPQRRGQTTATATAATATAANNYAEECFSLLRKVYAQLSGPERDDCELSQQQQQQQPSGAPPENSVSFDGAVDLYDDYESDYERESERERDSERPGGGALSAERQIAALRRPFTHLRDELFMIHGQAAAAQDIVPALSDDDNEDHASDSPQSPKRRGRPPKERERERDREKDRERERERDPGAASLSPSPHKEEDEEQEKESSAFSAFEAFLENLRHQDQDHDQGQGQGQYAHQGQGHGQEDRTPLHTEFVEKHEKEDPLVVHLGGSATSVIAQDLEVLLRRFVQAEREGDREKMQELLLTARLYYEELDSNFPNMDDNEFGANVELGSSFLLVLQNVFDEGAQFIAKEIDVWRALGITLLSEREREEEMARGVVRWDAVDGQMVFSPGALSEEHDVTERESNMIALLDAHFFRRLSSAERNRLLVLSAYDIVQHGDNHLDLALGFSLGILDNDRDRHKDAARDIPSLSTHSPLSSSAGQDAGKSHSPPPRSSSDKKKKEKKKERRSRERERPSNSAAPATAPGAPSAPPSAQHAALLYEDETAPSPLSLSLSSSLRASVPSLRAEDDDWLLRLILGVVLLTVLLVVWASHRQQRERERERDRKRDAAARRGGAGGGAASGREREGVSGALCALLGDKALLCEAARRGAEGLAGAIRRGAHCVWTSFAALCVSLFPQPQDKDKERERERDAARKKESEKEKRREREKEKEKEREKEKKISPSPGASLFSSSSAAALSVSVAAPALAVASAAQIDREQKPQIEREGERELQTNSERDGEVEAPQRERESERERERYSGIATATAVAAQSSSLCAADSDEIVVAVCAETTLSLSLSRDGDALVDAARNVCEDETAAATSHAAQRERESAKDRKSSSKAQRRERDREKERERERERERQREREREKEREIEQRIRDAQQREREKERERERRAEAERERRREREREDAERERERELAREREREREREAAALAVAASLSLSQHATSSSSGAASPARTRPAFSRTPSSEKKEKDTEREKEKDTEREKDREKEKEREKTQEKEREGEREKEKKVSVPAASPSPSPSPAQASSPALASLSPPAPPSAVQLRKPSYGAGAGPPPGLFSGPHIALPPSQQDAKQPSESPSLVFPSSLFGARGGGTGGGALDLCSLSAAFPSLAQTTAVSTSASSSGGGLLAGLAQESLSFSLLPPLPLSFGQSAASGGNGGVGGFALLDSEADALLRPMGRGDAHSELEVESESFLLRTVLDDLLTSSSPLPVLGERENKLDFDFGLFSPSVPSAFSFTAALPAPSLGAVPRTPPRAAPRASDKDTKDSEGPLISDLSPHAPVFLPSNLLFSPPTPAPPAGSPPLAPYLPTTTTTTSAAARRLLSDPFSLRPMGGAAPGALDDPPIMRFLGELEDDDDERWEARFL